MMLTNDGMIGDKPGAILNLWNQVRKKVGTVPKVVKKGMKFATLSAENVIDKVRLYCDKYGINVYPVTVKGGSYVVEDGTLCDVCVTFRVQAIEDGSYIEIAGYGQGADSQDKAGGKAGTYALKQALVQSLLAGGSKSNGGTGSVDTDDTDTPIAGGVKPKTNAPSVEEVINLFDLAEDKADYNLALSKAKLMTPDNQTKVAESQVNAKARVLAKANEGAKNGE